jgi:chloramphenicol 3-O phosphotransferase
VRERGVQIVCGPAIEKTVLGMHHTAADLARSGVDLVIEHAFLEQHWIKDCLQTLAGLPVLLVGVRPPLAVLEKREIERGFRVIGQARGHSDLVHAGVDYDLELDTSILSPKECAEKILAAISNVSVRDE